ncbi:MAG: hypothetical protein HOE69_05510 [Euryarchaeota archaeon]|jgi:hypothetical protein|nr:hypothetical protein [Euryarchaeota archaeon]
MTIVGILISALVAGVAAILVTVAIERWGGLHGGVLATVPSTIVPAAIGIWYAAATIAEFQMAMAIVPLGLVVNALFLLLWRVIPDKIPEWRFGYRLVAITAITLASWGVLASVGILSFEWNINLGLAPLMIGIGWLLIGLILGFVATHEHQPAPRGAKKVTYVTLLSRGIAAAASIGISVWLAGIGAPLISGIMSIFPAIFTTSMVALWLAQGEAVPAGAIGPMMFGSQSVSLYALLVAIFYPMVSTTIGLIFVSILGWILSVSFINVTVWFYLKSKANAEQVD